MKQFNWKCKFSFISVLHNVHHNINLFQFAYYIDSAKSLIFWTTDWRKNELQNVEKSKKSQSLKMNLDEKMKLQIMKQDFPTQFNQEPNKVLPLLNIASNSVWSRNK